MNSKDILNIYVAGKDLERAQSVLDILRRAGYVISYDWVAAIEGGPTQNKAIREREAVYSSDILVYLWEPDQESARYEAGMAMGLQLPIIVSGNAKAFFFQLPNIHYVESDELIVGKIAELTTTKSRIE